jgi:Na+-translocating ferredoxin:NAD+ oxidoreductase RnfG subunit
MCRSCKNKQKLISKSQEPNPRSLANPRPKNQTNKQKEPEPRTKLISKKNQEPEPRTKNQSKDLLKFVVRKESYNSLFTEQTNEEKKFNCGDPLRMYEYEEDDKIEHYSELLEPNGIETSPELLRQHLRNMNISDYLSYGSEHTK